MNPWIALGDTPPFVLPCDADAVGRFNLRATAQTRLETHLQPEPFVGRLEAPVLLLGLNPGVSDDDFALHRAPAFVQRVRACRRQQPTEWPYYYLDPDVEGPGASWSRRVLRKLVVELGVAPVARNVVLHEYLPYHSRRFGHERLRITSQDWTFLAVRAALARASAVFVTRGFRLWSVAIPEILSHPSLFRTRSVQNIVISPRNCPDGWESAVAAIRAAG